MGQKRYSQSAYFKKKPKSKTKKYKRKQYKLGGNKTPIRNAPINNALPINNTPLISNSNAKNAIMNEAMNQVIEVPLESGVSVLKNPRVKKVIQEGLVEIVDDAKPAINKLVGDSVSLIANVAEDVAGPLIGIPRTLGNMANIAETGIGLFQKTLGKVSNMTDEISNATNNVASSVSDLKQRQQQAFDNSAKSIQQITNSHVNQAIDKKLNKTLNKYTGGSNNKTKKSIFQQMYAYF